MDRRRCMCLPMLVHLLPFGPVAGAACCRAGGHYQGGWYRGGVDGTEAGRVGAPEAGRVGSAEAGRCGSTEAVCC